MIPAAAPGTGVNGKYDRIWVVMPCIVCTKKKIIVAAVAPTIPFLLHSLKKTPRNQQQPGLPSHRRLDEGRAVLGHGRIDMTARMAVGAFLAVRAVFEEPLVKQVRFDPGGGCAADDPFDLAAVV